MLQRTTQRAASPREARLGHLLPDGSPGVAATERASLAAMRRHPTNRCGGSSGQGPPDGSPRVTALRFAVLR